MADVLTTQRCSQRSRDDGVLPGGTAGAADRFVFVQLEVPWMSRVEDDPRLAGVFEPGTDTVVRAIWPVVPEPSAERASIVFGRSERASERLTGVESGIPIAAGTRDILVCTHGTRDACCGTEGMKLVRELTAWAASQPHVRLWRTSHLGGHRFAPTFVDLPAGDVWAFADPSVIFDLLVGQPSSELIRKHHRGWWGLGSPFEQAAETEAWATLGAEWREGPREGRVAETSQGGARAMVHLNRMAADGTMTTVRAHVSRSTRTQLVSCGTERPEPEYVVTQLELDQGTP
jgi:hypothetical protein